MKNSHNSMPKILRFLKNSEKYFILILAILPLIWVLVWFRDGRMIAGGEEGLSLWKSESMLSLFKNPWYEIGTGMPIPFYIQRVPFYCLTTFLEKIFSSTFTQAFTLWLFISGGIISMFYLAKELIKENKIALLAGIFYFLNLYSFSQVWGRFQISGMFAWAYLPLFLFLWIKWLREGKFLWLISFLFSSIFFSHTFSMPGFLFTLWVPVLILILSESFKKKSVSENWRTIFRAVILSFFWVASNTSWIYPIKKLMGSLSVESVKYYFGSLQGVSQYFSTGQILLLRQSYLFGKNSLWFSWYSQSWVVLISVLILIIAITGWISSRKLPPWKWLTVMAFVGWFVSKGSNSPFGYSSFNWLFSNFPFMAVLRNPYEKFGIVWLLPYSIFFGLGVSWIYQKLKPKIREVTVGIVLFLSCGVLVWPMWNGDIYKNARVRVPDYYKQANNYLNQDKSFGRVLMLPLIPGDGVRYSWGYQGIEPSEFLFDKPAISKVLRTKYADDKYWQLYYSFINGQDYEQILSEMNVKYLILHDDLISEVSGASSSAQVRKTLEKNKNITLVNKYGQLEVYKYNGNERGGLFTVESDKSETINYREANNRHYIVSIRNAKKPYSLIFKETFNYLWQARINGETIKDHFLVYDYANGWRVDKEGDYTIDIVFKVWPWD